MPKIELDKGGHKLVNRLSVNNKANFFIIIVNSLKSFFILIISQL